MNLYINAYVRRMHRWLCRRRAEGHFDNEAAVWARIVMQQPNADDWVHERIYNAVWF